MTLITAVLLGLIQGLTEFLPISSSGHLALLQNIFHIEEADLTFSVLLHLGTLVAVLFAYRRDIRAVRKGALGLVGIGSDRGKTTRKNADRRKMALFLLVGTLPLVLAIPLTRITETVFENASLVAIMLMVNGTILYLADHFSGGVNGLREGSLWQAILVGLSQVIAVVPGISRSGITISSAMVCGFKRNFAVRLSFLLSIPAVLGATILSLVEATQDGIQTQMLPFYLCGMLASGVSGYFSIRLVKYLASKRNFGGFAYYCWGAGLVALVLSLVA